MLCRIPENMTGTDEDNTEMDSRLLASLCCEKSIVPYLFLANYDKCWQKVWPSFEHQSLFWAILTERKKWLGESLEESVSDRRHINNLNHRTGTRARIE
jgi:hypothetical protein